LAPDPTQSLSIRPSACLAAPERQFVEKPGAQAIHRFTRQAPEAPEITLGHREVKQAFLGLFGQTLELQREP